MSENIDVKNINQHQKRLRRILFRTSHRGIKEMDILLGGYARENIEKMSDITLGELEKMLNIDDQKFYSILLGDEEVPDQFAGKLMQSLIDYTHNSLKS